MIKTQSFARLLTLTFMFVAITVARGDEPAGTKPIDIGSRLELFVDQSLIDSLQGVTRELHSPELDSSGTRSRSEVMDSRQHGARLGHPPDLA